MKRFGWIGLGVLFVATSARAVNFGVGCANPCEQPVIAQGGTAVCTAVLTTDAFTFIVQPTSTAIVTDLDGVDMLPVITSPVTVPPFTTQAFPVTIATDAADMPGELIAVSMLLHGVVPGFSQVIDEQFGSRLLVVASDPCTVTTTTTPSTVPTTTLPQTTTTTVPSPTTTIPEVLRPECHSNGHGWGLLRKCPNLR